MSVMENMKRCAVAQLVVVCVSAYSWVSLVSRPAWFMNVYFVRINASSENYYVPRVLFDCVNFNDVKNNNENNCHDNAQWTAAV